jgi:PAS domain S-box-containing protein
MTAPRVAIVEDERILGLHLKQQLVRLGYDVVAVAASAEKALLSIAELRPDLVLMDIHIEGEIDGIEIAARISTDFAIPVIYVTAYSEEATLQRALATKPYGYLIKPFSERELHATIQMALERHRADSEVQASEERFRSIFGAVSEGILIIDPATRIVVETNDSACVMFGYDPGELVGVHFETILSRIPLHAQEDASERIEKAGNTGQPQRSGTGLDLWGAIEKAGRTGQPQRFDWRCKTKDDRLILTDNIVRIIQLHGRSVVLATARDTTESRAIEEQLHQAQKMEAIGQLTGGLAHDFNNLLAIITGNLELVRERTAGDLALDEMTADALEAAQQGARLTHQLLAYSRRQPLDPKVVNVASFIEDTTQLLRRTLGETIEIRRMIPADLWTTRIDPHQLQNALLNLAVNGRDAMPKGGVLIIEAANTVLDDDYAQQNVEVTPGPYVQLAVMDTGTGMPPEVVTHALEPFFTTKAVGKGSGLGLSMVYGFVKQSGGHIKIYSEIGRGTTVRLYLPKGPGSVDDQILTEGRIAIPVSSGDEVILLVEDDAMLRKLAVRTLTGLGYRVAEAEDGSAAMQILKEAGQIDLLLTDVVFPKGVSGPNLARQAQQERPGLKVLYMSGYTRDAIEANGLSEVGSLISKPFLKAELARKLREVLDQGRDG